MRQRHDSISADYVIQRERDAIADFEHHRLLLNFPNTDFGTLYVAEHGDDRTLFGGEAADVIDSLAMRVVVAMRKVDACDIHAAANHGAEGLGMPRCRSYCRDDFGELAIQS